MEEFEIVFDPLPPDALSRFATESLAAYNVAVTGESSWYPVGFFLKSSGGEWLGALFGGWLAARQNSLSGLGRAEPGQRHSTPAGGGKLCRRTWLLRLDIGNTQLPGAAVLREARLGGFRHPGRLPARSREILYALAAGGGSGLGSVDSTTRWRVRGEDPPRR
jgi:hypothetical protein